MFKGVSHRVSQKKRKVVPAKRKPVSHFLIPCTPMQFPNVLGGEIFYAFCVDLYWSVHGLYKLIHELRILLILFRAASTNRMMLLSGLPEFV